MADLNSSSQHLQQGIHDIELVFLHYWGGSAKTWKSVISQLPVGFKIHTPEFRGWGENTQAISLENGLGDLARDVEDFIAQHVSGRYLLVGHSMGGKVAQIIAGSRPDSLAGLLLVAPAPPTAMQLSTEQQETMAHAYDSAESVALVFDHVLTAEKVSTNLRQTALDTSLSGSLDAKIWWPKVGISEDITQDTANIDVPVYVLSGEKDSFDSPETLKQSLMPLLKNARIEIVDGMGHLLPLEAPTAIAASVLRLVDELL